ncbi:Nucleic acid-binding, OB-fold [Sesbania bispinosa]|nr:Nucleic acid-binding, OB-fold [Sesbania bispinosa]
MMKKFKNAIVEGGVYTMINFGVIRSVGNYRAAKHEYKLLFSGKTRLFPAQTELIPLNGLSLVNTEDVFKTNGDSNYLIDLVGLLTAVSGEKELITEGRKTRMIQLELTDEKGKLQCTVFGDYVDAVKEHLSAGISPLPVLVVQFFKVRLYKGCVVIQNVNNTSRILWNAEITEVNDFRSRLASNGIDPTIPMGDLLVGSPIIPLADDFLKLYPRKTPEQLQLTEEDGTFIVLATIIGIIKDEQWWYGACKCHKAVTPDGAQLLGKPCKELLAEAKVEKGPGYAFSYDDSFKVKKVCDDSQIITKFKDMWGITTPRKLKFDPPFPTTVEGDNLQCACETSAEDFEVLVDTRVASDPAFEASSSSGAQAQDPNCELTPNGDGDGASPVLKK